MKRSFQEIEQAAAQLPSTSPWTARATAWLQACDYKGINMLLEAISEKQPPVYLQPDALGLDLHNVSCAFIAEDVGQLVAEKGRLFLRNVRHGLFLVPLSVEREWAIGCPVDPAFALGGPREKNPYAEKLKSAQEHGITVDEQDWDKLNNAGER